MKYTKQQIIEMLDQLIKNWTECRRKYNKQVSFEQARLWDDYDDMITEAKSLKGLIELDDVQV